MECCQESVRIKEYSEPSYLDLNLDREADFDLEVPWDGPDPMGPIDEVVQTGCRAGHGTTNKMLITKKENIMGRPSSRFFFQIFAEDRVC